MSIKSSPVMFVFPGQGSQYRGMGSDICSEYPVAAQIYEQASDVLGYDMRVLSFDDPKDEIGLTRFTQPALMTHQIACLRVFQELIGDAVKPDMAAGHSLGEYTALVAAGSLKFEDGLQLVKKRGELMGEYGEGGMLALTLDVETARKVADNHYCQVASCNLPEQTVVGGRESDLEALAADISENYPRKRAIPLATEGAFHTYFMVTAAQLFREVLDATPFDSPSIDVLSNYTAEVHETGAAAIRTRLFFQLFNPVNWVGCLQSAVDMNVGSFFEFGGGLGKADTPDGKRPNLESIIKKTLRTSGHQANYSAVINAVTLKGTADEIIDGVGPR